MENHTKLEATLKEMEDNHQDSSVKLNKANDEIDYLKEIETKYNVRKRKKGKLCL